MAGTQQYYSTASITSTGLTLSFGFTARYWQVINSTAGTVSCDFSGSGDTSQATYPLTAGATFTSPSYVPTEGLTFVSTSTGGLGISVFALQ